MIIVSSFFTGVDRKPFIQQHFEFLNEKVSQNLIIAAGRKSGGEGGCILWNLDSKEEVARHMLEEPLAKNGALTYEMIQFDTDFCSDEFKKLIDLR